jgi:hypothetical protein
MGWSKNSIHGTSKHAGEEFITSVLLPFVFFFSKSCFVLVLVLVFFGGGTGCAGDPTPKRIIFNDVCLN